jgi:hypothetical protein
MVNSDAIARHCEHATRNVSIVELLWRVKQSHQAKTNVDISRWLRSYTQASHSARHDELDEVGPVISHR